jgi:hypothetical protein
VEGGVHGIGEQAPSSERGGRGEERRATGSRQQAPTRTQPKQSGTEQEAKLGEGNTGTEDGCGIGER